jgi:hypothetical protein
MVISRIARPLAWMMEAFSIVRLVSRGSGQAQRTVADEFATIVADATIASVGDPIVVYPAP